MSYKYDYDPLIELSVWSHLDSKTDLELILLKGHLIIENILEIFLKRNNIVDCLNYSFYRKINELEKLNLADRKTKDFIVDSLRELNKIRNKVAHEFQYKIEIGDFERWSVLIMDNLKGEKFCKYTFRTKIVHSFSVLSINILGLK